MSGKPTDWDKKQWAHWPIQYAEHDIPQGDNRHRVNPSEVFYIVQLTGSWVNVRESAERVVVRQAGQRYITFEKRSYQLRPSTDFVPLLETFVADCATLYLGKAEITKRSQLKSIIPYPFIYIAPTEARDIYTGNLPGQKLGTIQAEAWLGA